MAENNIKTYRNPDDPITLEELKSFLWAAATHLRGQIDAAGYKEYIFRCYSSSAFLMCTMNNLMDSSMKAVWNMPVCRPRNCLSAFLMVLIGAMCDKLQRMSANDL